MILEVNIQPELQIFYFISNNQHLMLDSQILFTFVYIIISLWNELVQLN